MIKIEMPERTDEEKVERVLKVTATVDASLAWLQEQFAADVSGLLQIPARYLTGDVSSATVAQAEIDERLRTYCGALLAWRQASLDAARRQHMHAALAFHGRHRPSKRIAEARSHKKESRRWLSKRSLRRMGETKRVGGAPNGKPISWWPRLAMTPWTGVGRSSTR